MGGTKNHSCRRHECHQDAGVSRRKTPLDYDTDMFGSPAMWCKKNKKTHRSEAKGHRSGKDVGVGEQSRKKKYRFFPSSLYRLFGTTSKHRHHRNTTPTREPKAGRGFGFVYSTPPPPPPGPLKKSSPHTPKRYLHSLSGMGITPPRSFRRTTNRTPTSLTPIQTFPDSRASSNPSTSSSSTPHAPSTPLNPTCESCFKTYHRNSTLRQSLLAHAREMYTLLQSWSDEGRPSVEPMEWQPEKATVVIEKERRPSEMCRVLMKMGSVDDWVGVMRGLEEKEREGGLGGKQEGQGGQKMEVLKEENGEGDSGLGVGGEYCLLLRHRRMAVDEDGGQG